MSAGSNALGLGSGLAKGLALGLFRNQEQKREQARLDEDKKWKRFQMFEPIMRQQALETGDWGGYASWVGEEDPELGKMFKKEGGSAFEHLAPILSPAKKPMQGEGAATMDPGNRGILGAMGETPGEPAPIPSRPAVGTFVPEKPRWTFGGSVLSTPEERETREIGAATKATTATTKAKLDAESQAKIDLAARLRQVDPSMSLADSLTRVGLDIPGRTATPPQLGSVGDEVARREAELGRKMTQEELRKFTLEAEQQKTKAGMSFGQDREAIAAALFGGRSFAQLMPDEQQLVITEEQAQLQKESAARALGGGIGRFNAPIDIPTGQASGLAPGTTAASVAGQAVPPLALAQRRRSMEVLKEELGRAKELLAVLPSEKDAAGVAPGAMLGLRRRMNTDSGLKDQEGKPLSYRSAVARLESVVDGMVNVLARAKAESIGTQTERDAERAYNAVVQLKTGLTNPLGGDTRESATARIEETLAGIDRVIAGLPATPVPTATPGARGGAPQGTAKPPAPGAYKDPNGVWVIP